MRIRCGTDVAGVGQTGRAWAEGDQVCVTDPMGNTRAWTARAAAVADTDFVGVGVALAVASANLQAAMDTSVYDTLSSAQVTALGGAHSQALGDLIFIDVMGRGFNSTGAAPGDPGTIWLRDADGDPILNEAAGEGSAVICTVATTTRIAASFAGSANGVTASPIVAMGAGTHTGGDGAIGNLDNVGSWCQSFDGANADNTTNAAGQVITTAAAMRVTLDELPVLLTHVSTANDDANQVGNRGYVLEWFLQQP